MLLLPLLVSVVLSASPIISDVPCQSVADCWLDAASKPIARPKKLRGKPVPRGDCGKNLQWLRTRLTCEQRVCTALVIGDRC